MKENENHRNMVEINDDSLRSAVGGISNVSSEHEEDATLSPEPVPTPSPLPDAGGTSPQTGII